MYISSSFLYCTVNCKVIFFRIEVREHFGGRTRLFSNEQEHAIVDMVVQNNTIRLKEIQQRVIQDNHLFHNIHQCSLATIDRVLKRNAVRMKQVYKVPFERNSDRVKEMRFQFVQVCESHTYCTFTVKKRNIFPGNYMSIYYYILENSSIQ